jgi:hypothetical protein
VRQRADFNPESRILEPEEERARGLRLDVRLADLPVRRYYSSGQRPIIGKIGGKIK